MTAPVLPGYRLRRLLHRGHSFEVYDAWSDERGCPVVVKRARACALPSARRRLLREGNLLRRLTHPHLVRAYEVCKGPRPAVILETLPGQTLGHLFDERGPLSIPDVVQLGLQMSSVLGYLHGQGIVHCDLKPANAVAGDGLVRLIDLSLARAPGPWPVSSGTAGYLAPEQARGADVTTATDVWGLGLLLLEAASGDEPYPVGCPEYDDHLGPVSAPTPLRRRRRVPRSLGALVDAMTELDAASRPGVQEVVDTLGAQLTGPVAVDLEARRGG